jgi:hypothetical protein
MCTTRIDALNALPSTTKITIAGQTHSVREAIAIYQAVIDLRTALRDKRTEEKQAQVDSRAADTACKAFDQGVKAWAVTTFPAGSKQREGFGATRKKRAPLTAEERVAAKEKARATRKARGTKGPKEKLTVRGDVSGVVVTPVGGASSTTPSTSH